MEEEVADDASEIPSMYSPPDDIEETTEDEEETRQSKRARYSKGESSASSPTKQSNPEMDDTGSSSPSAKEQTTLDNSLVVEPLNSALPSEFAQLPSVSLASSEEELRYVDPSNALFDYLLLHDSYSAFFVVASSQHPAASPAHATEITSSRAEPDEQPMYPLPGAAAADVAGTSAAAAAPSAPPATAASQEDLAASASTPSFLLNHISLLADVVF